MDNQDEALHGLENEYMDDLIRLAVKRERMQEAEEILKLSREPVTPEEESRLDRIWSQAEARMDEINARKKKEGRNQKIRSINNFLSQAVKIAACLVLITAIGTTIAIAKNDSFRSAVFRLFVTENTEDNTISMHFGKDADAAFDVPADWEGVYFPSVIPEEFVKNEIKGDSIMACARYMTEDKEKSFDFYDMGDGDSTSDSGDGSSSIMINGNYATIIENSKAQSFEIDWICDNHRWLSLITYGMTREEAIILAESVVRVHPDEQ